MSASSVARDAGIAAIGVAPTRQQERADGHVSAWRGSAVGTTSELEAAPAIPPSPWLVTIDGSTLVNLAGGPPTIRPFGARAPGPTQIVSGHVVDGAGQPVAGAIVLVDKSIGIEAGNIMVAGGATTDATGAFTIGRAPAGTCVAIAFANGNWSELVELTATPAELRMIGHGKLTAKLTYAGHGEVFDVKLRTHDQRFRARYRTEPDGQLEVDSLPPGTYTLTAGLAQSFGGGQSGTIDRQITIVANRTAELELALTSGTTVVLTSRPPADLATQGLKYWLFSGLAPAGGAEARTRTIAEHPPNLSVGGSLKPAPIQFHDVAPGTYAACAGIFDAHTMDALDAPFGCTPIVVHDGESVRELEIAFKP